MVHDICADFEKIIQELRMAVRELADGANDEGTSSDLLLSIEGSLEKHIWMLKAYLG